MDSGRLLQLLIIAAFSAAVALIGLNELSQRFIKSGAKAGDHLPADQLIKNLRGEVSIIKPHEGRPTPRAAQPAEKSSSGEAAYGAVQSGAKQIVDKLLP